MKGSLIAATVVLGVFLILVVIGFLSGTLGRPLRYEIADGFEGWVTVVYGEPSCPELGRDGMFLVIRVDASGQGCTSSLIPSGWRLTKYVRAGSNAQLVSSGWADQASRMVWAGAVMSQKGGYAHDGEFFFVGTGDQLKTSWSKQPAPRSK